MYKEIDGIDTTRYRLVDEYPENRFEYNLTSLAENRTFTFSRDDCAKFVFKKRTWEPYAHIGEKVAYELAKKIGIKCCRAELYRKYVAHRLGNKYDIGVISIFEQSSDDVLMVVERIVSDYAREHGVEGYFRADIELIFTSVRSYMESQGRPENEIENFVTDFITMTVFDLKYGNYDRKLGNCMLRKNRFTGVIDLYPMFDNEAILGFTFKEPEEYDIKTLRELINQQRSAVCRPEDRINGGEPNFEEMLQYLLENYPEQTEKAAERVFSIGLHDLGEILDNIPNLPAERKKFAKTMFIYRDFVCRKIFQNYKDKKEIEKAGAKLVNNVCEDNETR